jgi:hypothetical protein
MHLGTVFEGRDVPQTQHEQGDATGYALINWDEIESTIPSICFSIDGKCKLQ